jgi:thymidylate synthase ThyX
MFQPQVEILADTQAPQSRLTTFLLHNFPKCLLAELNTHRMLSRNAASSRAIPAKISMERIKAHPYVPKYTLNKRGMVGSEIDTETEQQAIRIHLQALDAMLEYCQSLYALNIHKEHINRLLEPWMVVPVLVSATEWDNFFELRCAPNASPHFRDFALAMRSLYQESKPSNKDFHAPFADDLDQLERQLPVRDILLVIAGRCARISYNNHLSGRRDIEADLNLGQRLLAEKHMSPFEHIAIRAAGSYYNLRGFASARWLFQETKLGLTESK